MGLRFIPPVEAARYALSIGNFFRTYDSVARAKIAFHAHGRYSDQTARILEMVNGQWFTLYTVENPRAIDWYKEGAGQKLPWYRPTSQYHWETRSYTSGWKAAPMTAEEYALWRIEVDHELIAQKPINEIVALFDNIAV